MAGLSKPILFRFLVLKVRTDPVNTHTIISDEKKLQFTGKHGILPFPGNRRNRVPPKTLFDFQSLICKYGTSMYLKSQDSIFRLFRKVNNYKEKRHSATSWNRRNSGMRHPATFHSIPPLSAFFKTCCGCISIKILPLKLAPIIW